VKGALICDETMEQFNTSRHSEGGYNLIRLGLLNSFANKIYQANPDNKPFSTMDITSPEVLHFLQKLYDNNVKYMLVGGVATTFHGYIRTTQDLDLWVQENPENKDKLIKTLEDVNVPGAENYRNVKMIAGWSDVTIGDQGFVADFMDSLKGFSSNDFDKCYSRAKDGLFEGVPIKVLHINDLIYEKKISGRDKDKDDVLNLERIRKERGNK
jgi:predicted nucleotidyltransferase